MINLIYVVVILAICLRLLYEDKQQSKYWYATHPLWGCKVAIDGKIFRVVNHDNTTLYLDSDIGPGVSKG